MNFFDDSNLASYIDISKVAIYFTTKQCSGAFPATNFSYISTATISGPTGNFTETFKDTCLGYGDGTITPPTNQAVLDALTSTFSTDYSNWRKLGFDITFSGICAVAPSALTQEYEFIYGGKNEVCRTRMYTYPLNFGFENLGHYDYTHDCVTTLDGAPWFYYYGPPASCNSGSIALTRWGFMEQDGRLVRKYFAVDSF